MDAVILVGHGAAATDTPKQLVAELKKLEAARAAKGSLEMSQREAELDRQVRGWPRTPKTDPYQAGLEAIAERLRSRLGGVQLWVAYNEFCAPSVEETIERAAVSGAGRITLITTMFTRGGVHSETELPAIVAAARRKHPGLEIVYVWPFDLEAVADFLAGQVERVAARH